MESVAYLWRDGEILVRQAYGNRIGAEDFLPILNSPTILQCQSLRMENARFSFKDYKLLYTLNVIELFYDEYEGRSDLWQPYWQQFLEEPGVKPLVAFRFVRRKNVDKLLGRLSKSFFFAVSPNAIKIIFVQCMNDKPWTEFRETNITSREKLELKKGLPVEYQNNCAKEYHDYTLERSSI